MPSTTNTRTAPVTEAGTRDTAALGHYQDSLREAMNCLETAGRHLRRGSTEHADQALQMLLTATAHLREAIRPAGDSHGAE